jgi:TolB-like protein/DNA-binding winged helix-turn-helix (wHTH) protein/Tfp pilus assembly protein PilF
MAERSPSPVSMRFGPFEVSPDSGELRKNGVRLKLSGQAIQVLLILLGNPGQLVTREELQQKLWPGASFGDFEHGLNAAVNRLREVLSDSATQPKFIETVPRRGYRFIVAESDAKQTPEAGVQAKRDRKVGTRLLAFVVLAGIAVAGLLVGLNVRGWRDRFLMRAANPRIQALAVLPLENLSGDPTQDYFADGMTDELITSLGRIGALRVISRTSVMQYKSTKKPLPEIARELGVDAIVDGTVLRSGNRVRITANLLHAPTDRHLWAESYERDLRDVLALQNEVADAIAREIKLKLTPQEQARLVRTRPINPEAHELYLKGSEVIWQGGDPNKSREYFQQAVQKDPNFAPAYVGIARTYWVLGASDVLPAVEAFAQQKAFARKALELDDSLDSAHLAVADALFFGDWDWPGAEREFKRTLEANPNSEDAHAMYSRYLAALDRREEAITEAKRALEVNPVGSWSTVGLGMAYYFGRNYDEAMSQLQKALKLNPAPAREMRLYLASIYREKGLYKDAIREILEVHNFNPFPPALVGHLGNTYARAGNKAEAQKILRRLIEKSGKEHVGHYAVALIYAGLGEKDRAIEWLDKAYEVHDKGMCFLKVDPPLDPLRSDPRFQDLLRRMNFPL